MKNILLFRVTGLLGLVCMWGMLSSAALPSVVMKGRVKNAGDHLIYYISTVNGVYTTLSKDTLHLQPDSTFTITFPSGTPEKVIFILWQKRTLGAVYAQPGVTEIEIDASTSNDIRIKKGSVPENEAMRKLTKLNDDVWDLRARRTDVFQVKGDTVATSVYHKLLTYAQQMESHLKDVNEVFRGRAIQDIRMQLLLVFTNQYFGIWSIANEATKKEWHELFVKMLGEVDLNHPENVWSNAFSDAIQNQAEIQMFIQNPDYRPRDSNEYNRKFFDEYATSLKGRVREVALVSVIADDYLEKKQSTEIPELCKQFTAFYPKSVLAGYVDKILAENILFNQPIVSEDIRFMDVAQMNSLKEITDSFSGKVVFIDLWATWCRPCRDSFASVKPLQQYAKENDVVLLYISIDRPKDVDLWKKMANHYDLKGEHAMVNKAIDKNLRALFGKGDLLAVPHCAIINKKGEMQFRSAASPEEMDQLAIQLREAAK